MPRTDASSDPPLRQSFYHARRDESLCDENKRLDWEVRVLRTMLGEIYDAIEDAGFLVEDWQNPEKGISEHEAYLGALIKSSKRDKARKEQAEIERRKQLDAVKALRGGGA